MTAPEELAIVANIRPAVLLSVRLKSQCHTVVARASSIDAAVVAVWKKCRRFLEAVLHFTVGAGPVQYESLAHVAGLLSIGCWC